MKQFKTRMRWYLRVTWSRFDEKDNDDIYQLRWALMPVIVERRTFVVKPLPYGYASRRKVKVIKGLVRLSPKAGRTVVMW